MGVTIVGIMCVSIYLLAWGSGTAFAFLAIFYALFTFLSPLLSLDSETSTVLVGLTMAVPLSARLAGGLLDTFSLSRPRAQTFSLLAIPLACGYYLQTGALMDYLDGAASVLLMGSTLSKGAYFVALLNALLLSGSLIALAVMILSLAVELPVRWIFGALREGYSFDFAGVRVLVVILGFSLTANLAAGLVSRELRPLSILKVSSFSDKTL